MFPLVLLLAAATTDPPQAVDATTSKVAATVGDVAIHVRDVEWELARVLKDRKVDPEVRGYLQAKMLQQLVDRQLVLHWLDQSSQGATRAQIERECAGRRREVEQRNGNWEDYLRQRDLDETQLKELLRWQVSWRRYLKQYLDDENLQRYFDSHRRDFDGTRLRVAQILIAVAKPGDPQCQADAVTKATELRKRIENGEWTFADAAQSFSAAPSARLGGDIGTISRHDPMPEVFSRAAFALEPGEMSKPVITPFGVHLIQCLEVEGGQRLWEDVRDEIERAVSQYLLEWASGKSRGAVPVRFTGASAHFRPGTEEVIMKSATGR